jgi:hypothetical protein
MIAVRLGLTAVGFAIVATRRLTADRGAGLRVPTGPQSEAWALPSLNRPRRHERPRTRSIDDHQARRGPSGLINRPAS